MGQNYSQDYFFMRYVTNEARPVHFEWAVGDWRLVDFKVNWS